ncbi:protein of unknown function [Methylorubrum extorquens DM4]|uniref:Uncharacterized protein n=1 Tax=Methylorubrum extorquens (strain DSM 6343 / CIP 106787 / DM4) TaxID=661410 RepID=C7CGJ0_METED|nr:protein of unknown function [Methylorubrum extorquens DM4]
MAAAVLPAHPRQAPLPPLAQAQRLAACPVRAAAAEDGGCLRHGLRRLRDGLFDDLFDGIRDRHLPRPAPATGGVLWRGAGRRSPANARTHLGLDRGFHFGLLNLRDEEAWQDAAMLGRRLVSRRRNAGRGGLERGPQGCGFGVSRLLLRLPRQLRGDGDEASLAVRLGFDGERSPNAVAQHTDPDAGSLGLCSKHLAPAHAVPRSVCRGRGTSSLHEEVPRRGTGWSQRSDRAGFDLADGARQSEPLIKIISIDDLIWPDGSN